MRIGFDLDRVFIAYPPFVPDTLIDWLFKDHTKKELAYRFPGKLEQAIRKLSHLSLFRPPIEGNIKFVKELAKKDSHQLYLISGRFGFLKGITLKLVKKYGLEGLFKKMEFNFENEQPHLFKDSIINKHRFDIYIDDDLPLLLFLEPQHPKTKFFWLSQKKSPFKNAQIKSLKNLAELQELRIL